MATAKKPTARITLKTVIEHAQVRHEEIIREIAGMKRDMLGMERRLTRQIDGIDARLDDLEITVVPALKKAVGIR